VRRKGIEDNTGYMGCMGCVIEGLISGGGDRSVNSEYCH